MRDHRVTRAVVAMAVCLPFAVAAGTEAGSTAGVWQKHEYNLTYAGFTTSYSCDGIAAKLKLLLLAAGARDDAQVIGTCSDPREGPSQIATARATFYTLAPESAAAAATDPAAERVAGLWRPVEFRVDEPDTLDYGDCELVAQFDRELLPMFTTRNRDSHMSCMPHQRVLGGISLRFEAFSAPPKPKAPRLPAPQ